MAHEYIEANLMSRGFSYNEPNATHTAHFLAPSDALRPGRHPFAYLWEGYEIPQEEVLELTQPWVQQVNVGDQVYYTVNFDDNDELIERLERRFSRDE